MKATVEKSPNCKATVTTDFPADEVTASRDLHTSQYVRYAKLPGFRPGKAPKAVVEKRFAPDIKGAVEQELVEKALQNASSAEKLPILSVSNVAVNNLENGGVEVRFDATLRPEVALPEYKGLKIEVKQVDVNDELISGIIERQREHFATQKDVTGRASKMGDFVVVDYKGKIDGQDMKEMLPESESFLAENSGFLLKLDSGNFLPGFCDQVAGASIDETKIVVAHIPDEIPSAVAGRDAVFEVTVKAVKEQELPEVNDEFAGRVLAGKNLEELRAYIREQVTADVTNKVEQQKRALVVQALREKVEFDLPEEVVNSAAQRRVNELVSENLKRGVEQGVLVENEPAILEAATKQAQIDVKDEFMLAEVIKSESLRISDSELQLRIAAIAANAQTTTKRVQKLLEKNDTLSNLRSRMLLDKAVDFLVEHADITVTTVQAEQEAEPAAT